jgi:non-specific serine/threonine protein kinase/serine/threonine-protein kinase
VTPERWQQVKEAFQEALELAPGERTAFLDRLCAAEPELRQEIESLLRHHDEAGNIMERPAAIAPGLAVDDHDPWLGRDIGPYQTVSRIGEGGMGAVYQAIRVDDHYLKNVAIKLVRGGLASGPALRRFKSERQIMASLEHPNIARLLDGGTTDNGVPYLVMEYIAGRPIDAYCDENKLNTVERLTLFCQVCAAVQYAHQNLIVHRDLKPANILVTADGTPKLLDFGIAKLLDPELFFQTVEGGTMLKAMTPEYASPEQVRGEPITTASDVYSLGVVLYRLLTGHPPYRIETGAHLEMARAISETQPEKPSAVISRVEEITAYDGRLVRLTPEYVSEVRDGRPALLRRTLDGDVDNIVLKALRKEPSRRYASVEQFADDIRRYLDGLPVSARADTIFYRSGKFVRRHKVPVAAGALVVLSLLGGIFFTIRQARIAEAHRARAERRFNDIRKLAHDLMFDVHDSIQHLPGATPARKIIVDDALQYLDSLAKEAADDASLQEELAQAYEKVGDVQGRPGTANLGDVAGALDSYRKSLAIREAIARADPRDAQARAALSQGYLRLGEALEIMGNYNEALKLYQQTLDIRKQLASEAPGDSRVQSAVAVAYDALGGVQVDVNQFDKSLESRKAAAAIFDSLLAGDPGNRNYRHNSALEHKKVGAMFHRDSQWDQALREYQYAAQIDEGLAKEDPNNTDVLHALAVDNNNIGDILFKTGDYAGAIKRYRQSQAIDEKRIAADPSDVFPRQHLEHDYHRLGDALWQSGDLEGAADMYTRAIKLAETNSAAIAGDAGLLSDLAQVYLGFGDLQAFIARRAEAPVAKKRSGLRNAIAWYEKSEKVWASLRRSGALSGDDLEKPGRVAAQIVSCQAELRDLR